MRIVLAVTFLVVAAGSAGADPIRTPSGLFEDLGRSDLGYREFRRARDGAVMVLVPGGIFTKRTYSRDLLSDGDPEPVEVEAFLIDRTEVTNAAVAAFLEANPDAGFRAPAADAPADAPADHPATGVSGHLALAYARWVGGDLPRTYEWEKAAGGPEGRIFPWGDAPPSPELANSFFTGPRRTEPVGSRPRGASPYGLLDMAGNVYERCYPMELPEEDVPDRLRPVQLKGGAWVSPHPSNLRCVDRCYQPMDATEGSVGFRVLIRDRETIAALRASGGPRLRVHDDVEEAFAEAKRRNLPVLLFLAYDTCGQCDRTRAQVFTDPRFVEKVNEGAVLLVGHDPGDAWAAPTEPLEGESRLYPGCRVERLREVFTEFVRAPDRSWIPDAIPGFRVSPGIFLLDPLRDRLGAPEDLILVGESAFPKSGDRVEAFLSRIDEARRVLDGR